MTVTVYGNNVSVKATPKTKEIIDEINKKLENSNLKERLSIEEFLSGDEKIRETYNNAYKKYYTEN